MRTHEQEIEYVRYEHAAPDSLWTEIQGLFVKSFAAPPYNESPDALQGIVQWGPDQLASPGGRLVIARSGERVVGFALSQRLDQDSSWLKRLDAMPPAAANSAFSPSKTVIVQELAVDEPYRGRGVAKQCIRELLSDRPEQDAVLGVFGQASRVREIYSQWGFSELGTSFIYDGTVTLHALHHALPWTA